MSAPLPTAASIEKILHDTFGLSRLRPGQDEVIRNVLQHRDTLAIMPSGGGKSLCYQLPSLNLPGTTVVVSPLISLMQDQAEKLEDAGIEAALVNSTLSDREEAETLREIRCSESEIVFATPERLSDPDFITDLQHTNVDLFVVDEAHCISHWGHDFRPAYLGLGPAIKALGDPTVLALTATATQDVIDDIRQQLGRDAMHLVNTGIYRPKLHYEVVAVTSEQEKLQQLLALIREIDGSLILYAATVKAVEELHQALQDAGESVVPYHGRQAAKARARHQEQFMQGERRIMVATNAFGMGIDKPDIRAVIHYQIPGSLEAYYQESGRAGRDGKDARCVLLYDTQDKRIQQFFLARHYPGEQELRQVYEAMQAIRELPEGETTADLEQLRAGLKRFSVRKLQLTLKLLQEGGVIEQDNGLRYHLRQPALDAGTFAQLSRPYEEKNTHDRQALERMVFYAQTGFCRWKVLLAYFGDHADWDHCGACDNCRHAPERDLSPLPARKRPGIKQEKTQPSKDAQLLPGTPVEVPKYGAGQVIDSAGDKVAILFPDSRQKTFLREYVRRADQ